ncbi:MAG TPA: CPBP family intramembrane glutamic endopeptidase [Acidobacteriaceae bacterium]|nr:CPBP family intramembrane glutamic endopeptidase [Acidobacteriaceae bacterium]
MGSGIPASTLDDTSEHAQRPLLKRTASLFWGSDGLRAGWRFLIYVMLYLQLGKVVDWLLANTPLATRQWTWPNFLFNCAVDFAVAIITAFIVSRIPRRNAVLAGLAVSPNGVPHVLKGMLWGFIPSALILIPLFLAGACSFHGLALHGSQLFTSALGWAAAMLLLGISEEYTFRGYTQQTLASSIGFWPAAILLSTLFGAVHYFFKPQEGLIDPISVGLYGLFWCFTLKRTGSLWFALGFHAASDYADMIVFAEPNTGNHGQPIPGHLLDIRFHGPDWLTGGPRGTEASALVFLVLAGLFYFFNRAYPASMNEQPEQLP